MTAVRPPSASGDDPVSIGDSLDRVVAALRVTGSRSAPAGGQSSHASARSVGGLFRGWAEAVGPDVAAHARPIVLDGGRLVVEVDEPGWATQLRFLEAELVAKVAPLVAPDRVERVEVRVAGAQERSRTGRAKAR